MPIDKLDPAQGIIAALRAEAAKRKGRAEGKPAAPAEPATASAQRKDVSILRKQMVEIAQSIDVGDAEAVRKARLRMVRAVLLWEFGPEIREHAEWQPMLESITSALEGQRAGGEAGFVQLIEALKR